METQSRGGLSACYGNKEGFDGEWIKPQEGDYRFVGEEETGFYQAYSEEDGWVDYDGPIQALEDGPLDNNEELFIPVKTNLFVDLIDWSISVWLDIEEEERSEIFHDPVIKIHPDKIDHIFKNKKHNHNIDDTPENRKLLEIVANNPDNYAGDKIKNGKKIGEYFLKVNVHMDQIWVETFIGDNTIRDGGINKTGEHREVVDGWLEKKEEDE